ncbi:MAG: hypothetical protein IT350_05585 [Deltaproteobacteria bacterium]|nr:hypothetical protein [Deltaproteobacteria bacterium]
MRSFFVILFALVSLIAVANAGAQECGVPEASTWRNDVFADFTVTPGAIRDAVVRADAARASGNVKSVITSTHIELADFDARSWRRVRGMDGRDAWQVVIQSEGATFLRAHFTAYDFEDGAVVVYAPEDTAVTSVVDRRRLPDGEGLWSPIVEGDTMVIEVRASADELPSLVVDRLSHGLPGAFVRTKEQRCHVDVNCDAAWSERKSGVGLMQFEVFGFGSGCTGSLIADMPETGRPWFLSANHCLSDQSTADTLVVFWNYETDACNGTVPSLAGLPQSAGAEYVAGNALSDFTLLSLAQDPPAGTYHLPLSLDPLAGGEAITVVHHPDLTHKRITYGNQLGDAGTHWTVKYYEGSTEGGSSGSPLFNAQNEIVGQLTGGGAACSRMFLTDRFGKVSMSWDRGLSDYLSTIPTGYTTTTTTVPPGDDDDDWFPDDDTGDDDVSDDDASEDNDGDSGDDDDDDGCGC